MIEIQDNAGEHLVVENGVGVLSTPVLEDAAAYVQHRCDGLSAEEAGQKVLEAWRARSAL